MDSSNVTNSDPWGFGAAISNAIGRFVGTNEADETKDASAGPVTVGTFKKAVETDAEHVREFTKEAGQPTPDAPRAAGVLSLARSFESSAVSRATPPSKPPETVGSRWTPRRLNSSRR